VRERATNERQVEYVFIRKCPYGSQHIRDVAHGASDIALLFKRVLFSEGNSWT
jgi:hypothetical protein